MIVFIHGPDHAALNEHITRFMKFYSCKDGAPINAFPHIEDMPRNDNKRTVIICESDKLPSKASIERLDGTVISFEAAMEASKDMVL